MYETLLRLATEGVLSRALLDRALLRNGLARTRKMKFCVLLQRREQKMDDRF